MTDPITDMLNQIKNAEAVQKTEVILPFSKLKNEIALIMQKENFLGEVKKVSKGKLKLLKLTLKYDNGLPAMEGFKRVSKPGQRIYTKYQEIKKVRGGYGKMILSTPKGLMTGVEAKKSKLGGEVLMEVW
ncbi:MAG: 30S ribosomal protein S8 [Candidatus Staskawiczbacteria bacterium]|nr:30S ribosomal protein S8 [Candidatus Staskawiczbacteria bacterium]